MGWQSIFDGVANNIPDIQLQHGHTYRFEFRLPVSVPGWVADRIRDALNMVQVHSVVVSGNLIQIDLTIP